MHTNNKTLFAYHRLLFVPLAISIIVIISGCDWFEHQEHELTHPLIPVFTLSGHVFNFANGEKLDSLELLLHQFESFDGALIDQTLIITQDGGYYEFRDVPRGGYIIFVYKENEQIEVYQNHKTGNQASIGIIEYRDYEFDIYVILN